MFRQAQHERLKWTALKLNRKTTFPNFLLFGPIIPLFHFFIFIPVFFDGLDRLINTEGISKIEAFLF